MFIYKRDICKIITSKLRLNKVNVILGAGSKGKTYLLLAKYLKRTLIIPNLQIITFGELTIGKRLI